MHIVVRFREHKMGRWVFAMQKVIARSIAAIPIPFVVATGTTVNAAARASAPTRTAGRTPSRITGTEAIEGTRNVVLHSPARGPVPAEPWTTPSSMTLKLA